MTKNEIKLMIKEKAKLLRLGTLAESIDRQNSNSNYERITFEGRLLDLLDAELLARENKRIQRGLKAASLKYNIPASTIECNSNRNFLNQDLADILSFNFLEQARNIIVEGATGCGKSYIASAIGYEACHHNFTVQFVRFQRLLTTLSVVKETGEYNKILSNLKKVDLLILDDFGMSVLTLEETKDFLEIIEERDMKKSTIFVSQLPSTEWYQLFPDKTFADAIMDRIISRSRVISLKGESRRS